MGWIGRWRARRAPRIRQEGPGSEPAPFLPATMPNPGPNVQLGFRDGESLTLPEDSSLGRALRAVADEISGGPRAGQGS